MSSPRRFRTAVAVVAATVTAAVCWTSIAGAASALDVIAVIPAASTVSMVVSVNPPPSLAQPGSFQVASGSTGKLRTDARALIGPQLSTGVVLDTSADGAGALQAGANGVTSLLLQLPDGTRTIVIGDGGDRPSVLSPLSQGAVASVGGVTAARSGGTRHTSDALSAAAAALPATNGQTRVLLLYTGGADAGGETAAALGRRLADAGIVLAVVSTGADQEYWSAVTAATGGVLVSAQGGGAARPFDRVSAALRQRFVLTFPRPSELPAPVTVSVTVDGATVEKSAVVPADDAGAAPAAGSSGSGSTVPWWILGALLVLAVVGAALFLARRWAGRPDRGPQPLPAVALPRDTLDEDRTPAGTRSGSRAEARQPDPRASRADARGVEARGSRAGDAEVRPGRPDGAAGAPLPRRVPATGTPAISGAAQAADAGSPATTASGAAGTASGRAGAAPGTAGAVSGPAGAASGAAGAVSGPAGAASGPAGAASGTAGAASGTAGAASGTAGAASGTARGGRGAGGASGAGGATRAGGEGSDLPRRQPGTHPLRPAAKPLPQSLPIPVDPERTVEFPRPRLGDGNRKPAPHPAADERAYSRLDEVTAQAAAEVTAGTLDFRHAVARIAMAAPGRVDLLDRVLEVERRLSGVQIGNSPPTEVVLRLLTVARRVVAGELALVDPTGVRVEQTAQILRLVRPDRTTRECRNAKELSRHVDLSTLTADAPAS